MRILIVDTYYPEFLKNFYKKIDDKLDELNYLQLQDLIFKQFFGTANFYSKNLQKLGIEAEEIIFNDLTLQKKWVNENNVNIDFKDPFYSKFSKKADRVFNKGYLYKILEHQIDFYKPDILYIQTPTYFSPIFLNKIKKRIKLLVAQIASNLPPLWFFTPYDLVFSSLPEFVNFFKKNKIQAEYLKLAFEPEILNYLKKEENQYPITFVGSFSKYHLEFIDILEEVIKKFPESVFIWGYGIENIKSDLIKKRYQGEAFGLDMYNILYNSQITINRHADFAKEYANNMRLFEATGTGAFLITDYKKNLNDLFKTGVEVEDYNNVEELNNKIEYFLKNDKERIEIAYNGQQKTLKEHTYEKRMQELVEIIKKYY